MNRSRFSRALSRASTNATSAVAPPGVKTALGYAVMGNVFAPLHGEVAQPILVSSVGCAVIGTGDSIHVLDVTNIGFPAQFSVTAKDLLHGFTVDDETIYGVDGRMLCSWSLSFDSRGAQRQQPLTCAPDAAGQAAVTDLKQAIRTAEWARLLELAEAGLARNPQDADLQALLASLRTMVGTTDPTQALQSAAWIAQARAHLAAMRAAAQPYLFSAPAVARDIFDATRNAVLVVQGNGTVHVATKQLDPPHAVSFHDRAEPFAALVQDQGNPILGYVSDGTLYVLDTGTLEPMPGKWTAPRTPTGPAATIALTAQGSRFWWTTSAGVYGLDYNHLNGSLTLAWSSGAAPWAVHQVGHLGTVANAPQDPVERFQAMNISGWIAARPDPAAPLSDGALAHLMLSPDGKTYSPPPAGKSWLLHGPFVAGAATPAASWTDCRVNGQDPCVLLSDSIGHTILCPTAADSLAGPNRQLLPAWSIAAWPSHPDASSGAGQALAPAWPTPAYRVRTEAPEYVSPANPPPPSATLQADLNSIGMFFPDMFWSFESNLAAWSLPPSDKREALWCMFWPALVGDDNKNDSWAQVCLSNCPLSPTWDTEAYDMQMARQNVSMIGWHGFQIPTPAQARDVLNRVYSPEDLQNLRSLFAVGSGATWEIPSSLPRTWPAPAEAPAWQWLSSPTTLFNSAVPDWFDPWGYNTPEDFRAPGASALPDCFFAPAHFIDLRFPQRPAQLWPASPSRSFAAFTNYDPAVILQADEQQTSAPTAALVATVDESARETRLRRIDLAPFMPLYDPQDGSIPLPGTDYGVLAGTAPAYAPVPILAPPTVLEADGVPAAYCVLASAFADAWIAALAQPDAETQVSPWSAFETQNGPGASASWQLSSMPLPGAAEKRPTLLFGVYELQT